MKAFTIEDIAREAGVGKATVSRVINGKGYISEATTRKVRAVMEKNHYRPSAAARSLSAGESRTIGLILPEINNPFFADILQGVSRMVDKCGYTLMLCGNDNAAAKDYSALEAMYCQRVKGLIYVPASSYDDDASFHKMQALLSRLACPVVVLDRPIARLNADSVATDNFSGAYMATEALIQAGHTRIGTVAGRLDLYIGRERLEGFRKALEQNGLRMEPKYVVEGRFDQETSYQATKRLLETGDMPTGFFLANNLNEAGFLTAIHEKGLKVPDDVAFVGFDEMPGQDVFNMPFSCLARDVLALGSKAAQLLFRRFDEPERPVEQVVLMPSVRLRGSERLPGGPSAGGQT